MEGKLGALFKGDRQVGGFLDWKQETILNESSDKFGDVVHKLASWRITAPSYWMFSPEIDVKVRLYSEGKGYWEGRGSVTSATRKIFDTLIHEEIEIQGGGILEGGE